MKAQAESAFFELLKDDKKIFDFLMDFGGGGIVFFPNLYENDCYLSPRAADLEEISSRNMSKAAQKLREDYAAFQTENIPVIDKLVFSHESGLLMERFVHVMLRKRENKTALSMIIGIKDTSESDKKRRQSYKEAFANSERFKRSIVGALPDLVIHCDHTGRYLDIVNYKPEKKLIYDKAEMVGKRVSEVLHDGTGLKIEEAIRKSVLSQKLEVVEYKLLIKGRVQYFEARIVPYKKNEVIALVRNITDEQEASIKLTRTKEALQQTNEMAMVGFFEHDFLENRSYWSKTFREIIEDSNSAPDLSLTMERLSFADSKDGIYVLFESLKNEKKDRLTREIQIRTYKGRTKWVKCTALAEYHKIRCVRFFCTVQDITQQKKTEQEQEQLITLTKRQNDQLKNFSGIVSHNLRSHTSNLKGLIDMIREDHPDFSKSEMFTYLGEVSENLSDTISNLEEIAKFTLDSNNELDRISLGKIVAKTITQVKILAEQAGIEIINLVPESVHVDGVPAYLDSIVLNFLTNAIKYRDTDKQSYVKLFSTVKGPYTVFNIEDNGLGIDLDRHGDKLFQLYKTFHRNNDSKGIGLFITRNQIESMGGHVEVKSVPGKGTTFMVFFPKVSRSASRNEG
ncbi:MAG: PAS domain-containing sensor histidine kinase [Candidatus Cyclonatronum sp.]|uniref:sensor histidine kinase n=1 Tax=Cyclonatronum sp. TaxID=3024185 RepID=UPI0025BEC7A6|nr:PAS domain-containing sensor histidine kinase [Cyclonatronum sp.]MCH8487800.1 PAS domain-containing sensor histidine kinase [Cyclonatronum sp.]